MTVMKLITINGALDIYYALSLLPIIEIPYLRGNYMEMFLYQNPDTFRMMCYFMLITGAVRLSFNKHRCNFLVMFSYMLEAYVYLIESRVYFTIDIEKASYAFVVAMTMAYMSYSAK